MDHLLSFEFPQPFHLMKDDTGAGTGDLYPFANYGEKRITISCDFYDYRKSFILRGNFLFISQTTFTTFVLELSSSSNIA